jgi:hypothetical protein
LIDRDRLEQEITLDERRTTMRRALQHYSNRLIELLEDDRIKRSNNSILRQDLLMNAATTQEVLRLFDNYEIRWRAITDNKGIACCALTCNMNDLKKSMTDVSARLSGAKPKFNGVENEMLVVWDI